MNGSLAAAAAYSTNGIRTTSGPLTFGSGGGGGGFYSGQLDEVTFYNRALSASEVANLYATGTAGSCFTNINAPVFVLQPPNQIAYTLNAAAFTAAAMGVPRPNYQWLFNGAPIAAA